MFGGILIIFGPIDLHVLVLQFDNQIMELAVHICDFHMQICNLDVRFNASDNQIGRPLSPNSSFENLMGKYIGPLFPCGGPLLCVACVVFVQRQRSRWY